MTPGPYYFHTFFVKEKGGQSSKQRDCEGLWHHNFIRHQYVKFQEKVFSSNKKHTNYWQYLRRNPFISKSFITSSHQTITTLTKRACALHGHP